MSEEEWTHEKLQGLLQISNEDRYVADHAFESTLDEINAALGKAHQDGWYEGRNYEIKLAKEGK